MIETLLAATLMGIGCLGWGVVLWCAIVLLLQGMGLVQPAPAPAPVLPTATPDSAVSSSSERVAEYDIVAEARIFGGRDGTGGTNNGANGPCLRVAEALRASGRPPHPYWPASKPAATPEEAP